MHDDDLIFELRAAQERGDTDRIRQLEQEQARRQTEMQQLKLAVLKQQMEQAQKPDDRANVTMTRKEEEEADIQTAHDEPTPEQQAKKETLRKKEKDQGKEYQQDMG
jgi:uncharacterized membrane protein YgaE (UPF0421/DUF939 family)